MQTLNEIIKFVLESNVINFCLMVLLLAWICKKIKITTAFNNATKSVEDYIEKSNLEKQNSHKLVKESKKLVAKLPQEIDTIEKFNKQKTDVLKNQLKNEEQKNIKKFLKDIEDKKALEEKNASNSILLYSFNKSIDKVEQDMIQKLKSKPELKYKFIDKSLDELDRIKL